MTAKARVVLDTNVLVSALLLTESLASRALALAEARCEIVTSAELLAELTRVLERSKFDRYIDHATRIRFVARIQSVSVAIVPLGDIRVARDPKDDVVLATAGACGASHIVTGDDDLLSLSVFGDSLIVSPRAFLDALADIAPR